MKKTNITIKRKKGEHNWEESFEIEIDQGKTLLLESLLKIQEQQDPTLAVRYGCRFKNCGLCAVNVNGVPRMACMTKVKKNMTVAPLNNLPVLQDLVVDRSIITKIMRAKKLFPNQTGELGTVPINEKFGIISKCTDCLACVSGSTVYQRNNKAGVAAPVFFVKLAQLQFHPQNLLDYKEKAYELGIKAYQDSPPIPCPYGIPIKKLAIDSFLVE